MVSNLLKPFASNTNLESRREPAADLKEGGGDELPQYAPNILAHKFSSLRCYLSCMAAVLLIMICTAYRALGNDGNLFANQQHKSANSTSMSLWKHILGVQQEKGTQTPKPSILFLIYCGGPSGRADMEAILETWGKSLNRVLVLSNTPNDMPPALVNHTNTSWHISKSKMLQGGGKRSAKESWKETLQKVNQELQRDPSIQWIVRSDSDTWWNVPLLEERLNAKIMSSSARVAAILPPYESLAMGQFFPLVNFKWKREVSAERSQARDLARSNGTDAYLSGGAGLILTRRAIENLYTCFPNITLKSHSKEDIWFSPLAHACNVTLVHSHDMHQFPWEIQAEEIPTTLSVHHVAGDGRKGYGHPSYYEDMLKTNTSQETSEKR